MPPTTTILETTLEARLAWWNHGVTHEESHRGQVAVYARPMGIEPALRRLIRGG